MVALFVIWLCLLVLGVALIEWWSAGVDFMTALGISGSSTSRWASSRRAMRARGRWRWSPPVSACSWSRSRSPTCPPSTTSSPPVRRRSRSWRRPPGTRPGGQILARHHWLDIMDGSHRCTATGSDGPRRSRRATATTQPAVVPLTRADPQLAGRAGSDDGLGGVVPLGERGPDTAPGAALPVHGDPLPTLHGPRRCTSPTTTTRSLRRPFACPARSSTRGSTGSSRSISPSSTTRTAPGSTSRVGGSTTSRSSTR